MLCSSVSIAGTCESLDTLWYCKCVVCVQGKVRDTYEVGDKLVIVTTDRQSAFDRILASIPYKVCTHSLLCTLMNDV